MVNTRNYSIEELKDVFEGCWVVTDPCYVLSDDNYEEFYGNPSTQQANSLIYKGVEIPLASNGGDGCWSFCNGVKHKICDNIDIALDSGTLAAIPIELCDHNWGSLGLMFENKPDIGEEDGWFVINGVKDSSAGECEKCFETVWVNDLKWHGEHGDICYECQYDVKWDDEDDC